MHIHHFSLNNLISAAMITITFGISSAGNAANVTDIMPCEQEKNPSFKFFQMLSGAEYGAVTLPLFKRYEDKKSLLGYDDKMVGIALVSVNEHNGQKYSAFSAIHLCGNFDVASFYYFDNNEDLLGQWISSSAKTIRVNQDEGWLNLTLQNTTLDDLDNDEIQVVSAKFELFDLTVDLGNNEPQENDPRLMTGKGEFFIMIPKTMASMQIR